MIAETLQRPHLSPSIKTYVSMLGKLYVALLRQSERKTQLSALVVLTEKRRVQRTGQCRRGVVRIHSVGASDQGELMK